MAKATQKRSIAGSENRHPPVSLSIACSSEQSTSFSFQSWGMGRVGGRQVGSSTGAGARLALSISPSVVSDSVTPWTVAHQSPLSMGSSRQGVGFHSVLQGIFPTQGSDQDLLHCRQILYQLSQQRSLISTLPRGNKKTQRTHHCAVPQVPRDISSKQSIFFLHFRDIPSWIILLCLGLFSYKIEGLQGMGWLHLGRKRRP